LWTTGEAPIKPVVDEPALMVIAAWMIPPGVESRHLARALAARPDLEAPVERAVAAVAGRPPEAALGALARDDPGAYEALALVVSAAHFLHPKVRRRIGFTAHAPAPVFPDEAEIDLEGGLLDAVRARGPLP
jgi:hypothetical protein